MVVHIVVLIVIVLFSTKSRNLARLVKELIDYALGQTHIKAMMGTAKAGAAIAVR
jgi:hypothetical protein